MDTEKQVIKLAKYDKTSCNGILQLKVHEGFKSRPYLDSVGVLTIGYGLNLSNGIDEQEASMLLEHRIKKLKARIPHVIKFWNKLTDARQWVLLNMSYNLGLSGLLKFKKMLAAMEDEDFDLASYELLDSLYAVQVGDRATQLAAQMMQG